VLRSCEFEDAPDHDKNSRAIAVLGAHEVKRLAAIDEKAAADATGILNNPVSVTGAKARKLLINTKPRKC